MNNKKNKLKEDLKEERRIEQWLKKIHAFTTQVLLIFVVVWAAMTLLNYLQIIVKKVPHTFISVINGTILIVIVSTYIVHQYIRRRRRRVNAEARKQTEV